MEDTFLIKILANAQQALDEIKEVNQKLGNTTEQAEKVKKSLTMTDVWASFTMAKGVVMGVVGALSEFVGSANSARMAMMGLNEVSKAYGQDSQKANQYAKELTNDGLMQLTSSAATLKFLMSSGFNISEAMNVAKSMKDIGAFNNTIGNLDQAMADAAKGIKTGSIELIENIGLTQKLSAVMDAAGVSTSAGIDITNNAAQRQALYNAIMAEGNKFQGNAAKLAGDSLGIYSQLGNAYEQLKVKIGETINVAFVPLADVLTKVVNFLRDNFAAAAGVVIGVVAGLAAALIPLTISLASMAASVTAITGGMNLLVGAAAAGTVGLTAYATIVQTTGNNTEDAAKKTEQLKEAINGMSKAEIEAAMDRAAAADFAMMRTIAYMEVKNKELEAISKAAALSKMSNKQEAEAFGIHSQALANAKKNLEDNTKAWNAYYEARKGLTTGTGAGVGGMSEAEKKAADEKAMRLQKGIAETQKIADEELEIWRKQQQEMVDYADDEWKLQLKQDKAESKLFEKKLKREQELSSEKYALENKVIKTKIKGDEQSTESGLKQTQSALSSMQSIFAAQSNQSRAMFNINKGLSLTQATIATYEGATNAYASGAKIDPTGVWPAVYAGIVTAAGLANIATIAAQEFEPVEDFISIPGKPLLKARPDDIVIGGTNLLGNGAGNDPLLKAMLLNNKILKEKSMQAILNLGDRLVYMQNLKGQKAVNQGRL